MKNDAIPPARRIWQDIGWAAVVVAMFLVVYVGSYAALVTQPHTILRGGIIAPQMFIRPEYRFGGDVSELVFRPVHELDRRWARPDYWSAEP